MKSLELRIQQLESRVDSLEQLAKKPLPPIPKQNPPQMNKPPSTLLWLKEYSLACIGSLLILIAMGWFIHYAFINNWLDEAMRISLGFIAGIACYSSGLILLKKRPKQGEILLLLGQGALLLTLFAAHNLYNYLSATSTIALMLFIVSTTTGLSMLLGARRLGLFSIFFAAVIPFAVSIEDLSGTFLLTYVIIITVAALGMTTIRNWKQALHISWVATLAYSTTLTTISSPWLSHFFIWTLFLLYLFPIARAIYKKDLSTLPLNGVAILITLPIAFTMWDRFIQRDSYHATSLFIAALLWTALAYLLSQNWELLEPKNSRIKPLFGVIIGHTALSTTLWATNIVVHELLQNHANFYVITLLHFIEIAAAVYIGKRLFKAPKAAIYLSLFAFLETYYLLGNFQVILEAQVLSLPFAALCIAILALFTMIYIQTSSKSTTQAGASLITSCLWITAGTLSMILIWNIFHQLFSSDYLARGGALITYVVVAELLIFKSHQKQAARFYAGGVSIISFVIIRLLVKEIWKMPIIARTTLFIVIGLLLLANALFDRKQRATLSN